MAGKFAKAADRFSTDLGELFNRSIRQALLSGLAIAIRTTIHDSSNAAVHWQLAAKGRSRPASRRFGKLRDLRGTNSRPGVPPVGRRGDHGINAAGTERFVREREIKEVIDKLIVGRRPATVFYFHHPLEEDWRYAQNANIQEAGQAAIAETSRVLQNRIAAGQARKNPL
jgi:hypothetical protein